MSKNSKSSKSTTHKSSKSYISSSKSKVKKDIPMDADTSNPKSYSRESKIMQAIDKAFDSDNSSGEFIPPKTDIDQSWLVEYDHCASSHIVFIGAPAQPKMWSAWCRYSLPATPRCVWRPNPPTPQHWVGTLPPQRGDRVPREEAEIREDCACRRVVYRSEWKQRSRSKSFRTMNWKTAYAVFFAGRFVSTPSMSR